MKFLKYICIVLAFSTLTQCKDYLDVSSPGEMNDEFVTSSTEEAWKLLSWAYAEYRQNVARGGNYNWQDPLGSDAEYMTEYPTANNVIGRLRPDQAVIEGADQMFDKCNIVLARASRIAQAISNNSQFQADKASGNVTEWTHLYGEAWTLWAQCYFLLAQHYGDVPFGYENVYVSGGYELTSRFVIYDAIIAKLKEVEGMMYKVGEGGKTAERLTSTYANALIGEAALSAGSWMTIRTDVPGLYGDVAFDTKGTDDGECVYARRKDRQSYLQTAAEYLGRAVNSHKGTVVLNTTDTRVAKGINNPFQSIWNDINSRRISPESLFEVALAPGIGQAAHPYDQGRAGANGINTLNCFGAVRIIPTFFYQGYEDGDMRRDVSMAATGNGSGGEEALIPFGVGTRIGGGGPAINKWDFNKGDQPGSLVDLNVGGSGRNTGTNYTVLRMADAMLMLAEAKAQTGDDPGALALVNQVRARAFGNNNHALSGLTGEALLDAIYAERKLELLGEGDIRWDMIRSGKFNERALAVRQQMADMMAGLAANGYYTFPNGRTISNYLFVKAVYLAGEKTGVTYDADDSDPALTPGWRGIFDWASKGKNAKSGPKNLAIKGLYEYIDPDGAEAAALIADGYKKESWGIRMLEGQAPNMYDDAILNGVKGRENMAPRYFHSMPKSVINQSGGSVTNGYGLPQQ